MAKTLGDIKRIREIASRLKELGIPQKTIGRIRRWATKEEKRILAETRISND